MQTQTSSIHDVLARNATSFFIPPFQRAYAWGRTEIERFFIDVSRILTSELNAQETNKQEHFFGTLVIKQETSGFASRSIIIDGQQRLTTTLIFLIALRDLETDQELKDLITNNYLKNLSSTYEDRIKLKQVTKDWEAYKALVNNQIPRSGVIKNAYDLLKKLISDKKKLNPNITTEHFIKVIQRLNVAIIFLDQSPHKGEDPQIIFETLNSLGKPLTLADLVRNYVLLNLDSNRQTEIYDNTWHPKIENILKESTSNFFRDYLQYKQSTPLKVVSDNNTKELYQEFKDFVENQFPNRDKFIEDILRYVKCYKWIITEVHQDEISNDDENNKKIKELLRNIFHDIKTEAFKPFVLGLLEYHQYRVNDIQLSDVLLISSLETIRTYLIRRRVVGLTQGENKNIVLLCRRIEEIARSRVSLIELLANLFYRLRLPNDKEIEETLQAINFYAELKNYSKFILGKIEEHNSRVSVNFRDPIVTIEHIMPQTLNSVWEQELGNNFKEIHEKYLHNIGNLILTEFNGEMGNKSFNEKKEKLNNSNLSYRLFILEKQNWNEQSILEHQSKMITWFLETFPLPEGYQQRNNWNTQDTQNEVQKIFSPLDSDISQEVMGSKPIQLTIFDQTIQVKTWQDVFVQFLQYFYKERTEDFDTIRENQSTLFGRDTIITWSMFKKLLEQDSNFKNRYKTLEGKTWNEVVKELEENLLFVHVNISSVTCIDRIAAVMNLFSMEENSVKIELR